LNLVIKKPLVESSSGGGGSSSEHKYTWKTQNDTLTMLVMW